jgi:hypothetical protein
MSIKHIIQAFSNTMSFFLSLSFLLPEMENSNNNNQINEKAADWASLKAEAAEQQQQQQNQEAPVSVPPAPSSLPPKIPADDENWGEVWAWLGVQPDPGYQQTKWKTRQRARRHILCTNTIYEWYEGEGCPLCDEAYKYIVSRF